MDKSIFEELSEEHERFRQMMTTLTDHYDQMMFQQLGDELERHQEAEEDVLYAKVRDHGAMHELVLEGIEEHRLASDMLRKLQGAPAGNETWIARMKVMRESVEHHLEHEEREFFPRAQEIIPQTEAVRMTRQFESSKQRVRV